MNFEGFSEEGVFSPDDEILLKKKESIIEAAEEAAFNGMGEDENYWFFLDLSLICTTFAVQNKDK